MVTNNNACYACPIWQRGYESTSGPGAILEAHNVCVCCVCFYLFQLVWWCLIMCGLVIYGSFCSQTHNLYSCMKPLYHRWAEKNKTCLHLMVPHDRESLNQIFEKAHPHMLTTIIVIIPPVSWEAWFCSAADLLYFVNGRTWDIHFERGQ